MILADVVELYRELDKRGILIWIDGGWAVDAALGMQTRPHADADIVIQTKDVAALREFLEERGYRDVPRGDTKPWNFVLGDGEGRLVDVHVVTLDAQRNGLYGPLEVGIMYPAGSLTGTGVLGRRVVRCISVEHLIAFHTGYAFDENDVKDVSALCERFGIPLPEDYAGWGILPNMVGAPKQWMPRERWDALVRGEKCPLCTVIESREPADYFAFRVADLNLSRLYLARNQFVRGYCTLVCTRHVREPYHLTADEQSLFFGDLMRAAQALERAFSPTKMNLQLLGNEVPHLHAHLMPRYYGDPAPARPIDPGSQFVTLSDEEYVERIRLIRLALGTDTAGF